MPPPTDLRMPCSPLVLTTESFNATGKNDEVGGDDLNALLYIVVTLLFYSLGIIVGIITYLKRERREMEEDKTFEVFMSLKNDPFTATKLRRVQIISEKLKEIEKARQDKEEMEQREKQRLMNGGAGVDGGDDLDLEGQDTDNDCDSSSMADDTDSSSRPEVLDVADGNPDSADAQTLQLKKPGTVFQVSPSGEPISSVVAKIFDTERRGGLPNSPKALHLFETRGRLSRDQSLDSTGKEHISRDQSIDKLAGNSTTDSTSRLSEPEGCLVTNV